MSPPRRGEKLGDRYVLGDAIGEGGMGVVYSAQDDKLGRTVALKLLTPHRAGSKTARSRLKREARAAAALDNPGIAQVFDVGETPDGGVFIVMELVRGKSVRGQKPPALAPAEALRIVGEVARTLDAAHRVQLIHRDVKPDNIMVRDDGRAVLLDFGIAKDVGAARPKSDDGEDSVVTGQALLGTPPYTAPEQIRGKDVVPASDQFALGVVAFGFLTGKMPWEAPSDIGLLGQILMAPARAATSIVPSLPAAVDQVFDRVLAKDPAARFPTVEAFAEALEIAVTGTVSVRPVDPPAAPVVAPSLDLASSVVNFEIDGRAPEVAKAAKPAKAPVAPAPEPIVIQRPAWNPGAYDAGPSRGTLLAIVAAVTLVIAAAAGGVWYGRNNAGAPPSGSGADRTNGDSGHR